MTQPLTPLGYVFGAIPALIGLCEAFLFIKTLPQLTSVSFYYFRYMHLLLIKGADEDVVCKVLASYTEEELKLFLDAQNNLGQV